MADTRVYFAGESDPVEPVRLPEGKGRGTVLFRDEPKVPASDNAAGQEEVRRGRSWVTSAPEKVRYEEQAGPQGGIVRKSRSWVLDSPSGKTNGDGLGGVEPTIEYPTNRTGLIVRQYRARNLSDEFVNRWDHLESRSYEPNPFLSPWFVLPALRNLPQEADKDPIVLAVESEGGHELLGIGLFEPSMGTGLLPLPHLRSWKSVHSYLDGYLLDRERPQEAAGALFEWVQGTENRWHGLSFQNRSDDTESSWVLEEAASRCGIPWREERRSERAFAMASMVPEDCLGQLYNGKRRREMRRRIRKLESFGAVDFSISYFGNGASVSLESFLEIEAMGWKGEEGTALLCHPGHEQFAREMVAGLSKVRKAVVAQLTVGDDLAASNVYLRAGDSLFSIKSGWDPRFKEGSPGVILKLRMMETIREREGIEGVDSCAPPHSWIEPIWPSRRRLTTGVFPTSPVAQWLTGATLKLKSFKRKVWAARGPAGFPKGT